MMKFLKGLFNKEEKKEVGQNFYVNAEIPMDEDYWFRVNGNVFLGRCIYNYNGQLQFAIEQGVFTTEDPVVVVQKATPEEAKQIQNTVEAVELNHVVRFVQHVYQR